MALAARCPNCRALFRVVADQLKLRGGLVRCGSCRQVFDAIGSLSYVDDVALARERAEAAIGGAALPGPAVAVPVSSKPQRPREAPPPPPAKAGAPSPAGQPSPPTSQPRPPTSQPTPSSSPSPRIMRPVDTNRRAVDGRGEIRDELAVPTLIGIAEPQAGPETRASIESQLAAVGYRNRPATYETDEAVEQPSEEGEPEAASFLPTEDSEREQRLHRALAIACGPLALLAAIQFGLTLRNDALETWPSLRPSLTRACAVFGCTVGWPTHAELLTIVGSELAAVPGTDVIELDAAVRSRASFIMALPAIEVTLTDTQNRTIARKVFLPADYLASSGEPSSRIDEGLAPGTDLSLRLVFEARGLSAAGFVLYPFYL
jgi:predicted Zn finger-like uncharacterized protein